MQRKIPNTPALKAFEAAARHESYTQAANELSATPGAVCRQVAGLESFLGTKLFRRVGRGMVLTDDGVTYHRVVARRLDELERDAVDLIARRGRGATLEIGVGPTFAMGWLLPRLPDFQAKHPGVTLNLASRTRPFLFEDTNLDAAVYAGDGHWSGAVATFLMEERLVPVCSPRLVTSKKPLSFEQLGKLPLLQQMTRPYAWRQWFESTGYSPGNELAGPRYELFSMTLRAAIVGLGVGLVPEFEAAEDIAAGRLVVPIKHSAPPDRSYYFVHPERGIINPAVHLLRDWLVAQGTSDV